MLNEKYTDLNRSIEINCPELTTRSKFIALAVAQELSRHLPLPLEAKVEPLYYYRENVMKSANPVISCFNEKMVMDSKLCTELTYKWWLIRYFALYPGEIACYPTTYGMVDTYVNAGEIFSPFEHELINKYKEGAISVSLKIHAILKDDFNGLVFY